MPNILLTTPANWAPTLKGDLLWLHAEIQRASGLPGTDTVHITLREPRSNG